MKRFAQLDFVSRPRKPVWTTVLALAAIAAATLLTSAEFERVGALREGVEQVQQRVDQRQQAARRAALQHQRRPADVRRVEQVLEAQSMSRAGSGLPIVDWIESAWMPTIGLRALVLEQAGKTARIEGGATDLSHIYQFAEQLRDAHPERRIGLIQHQERTLNGVRVYTFSIGIEQP
ncbi:MAG: hypothetical protein GAK40_00526 [Burkholderia plantarii]|nr:MAG: hypothetical protein GAK40_00526 [Burkholderia plantarii]